MNAPQGLGMWVAFAGQAGGHAVVAGALPELGVKWVAPRGGAGGFRDASWSRWTARDSVKRYHDAGLSVYPWIFSRPWSWQNEIVLFQQFIDEGADGVIIDAEVLWDHAQHDCAERYMAALDKALPDTWIADAPWAYPSYHPDFPFVEFGRRVNARLQKMDEPAARAGSGSVPIHAQHRTLSTEARPWTSSASTCTSARPRSASSPRTATSSRNGSSRPEIASLTFSVA